MGIWGATRTKSLGLFLSFLAPQHQEGFEARRTPPLLLFSIPDGCNLTLPHPIAEILRIQSLLGSQPMSSVELFSGTSVPNDPPSRTPAGVWWELLVVLLGVRQSGQGGGGNLH